MKKVLFYVSVIVALTLIVLSFTSCTKEKTQEPQQTTTTKSVIYTTKSTAYYNNISVLVDNVYVGRLKFNLAQPSCTDTGYIVLNLTYGSHIVSTTSVTGQAGNITNISVNQQSSCQFFSIIP